MNLAIKALSLATKVLWFIVILFSVTAAYSAANLRVSFGESKTSFSDGIFSLSIPFFVNNTGFYEIRDLNVTTYMKDCDTRTVSISTTIVPIISPNNNLQETHNVTMNLRNLTGELQYLVFNDSIFYVYSFLGLKLANVIPIQISTNATMQWGAPLCNFSIGDISLNYAKRKLTVPLSFENHAFFSVNGTMHLEVYNNENEQVGTEEVTIEVPSGSGLKDFVEMDVDPSKLTSEDQIQIFFETLPFSVEPIVKKWEIPNG